jgi:hypothetical protein
MAAEPPGSLVPALSGELGVAAGGDAPAFAWQVRAGVAGRRPQQGPYTIVSGGVLAGLWGDGTGVSAALFGRITWADRRSFALGWAEAGPYTRLSGPSSTGGLVALTIAHWLGPQLSVWTAYGTGDVHVVGVTAGFDLLRAVFTMGQMMFPD